MLHVNYNRDVTRAIHLNVKNIVFFAVMILMPFFMLSNIVPFVSDVTLGEDYTKVYMRQQMEMMFALKTGSFPLFISDFAAGQAAISLTSGQIFHPISHLAFRLPGYWNGHALEWVTLLKLLSLGCAQIFLFLFLRRLKLNRVFSFIISAATVYNLRMLDLFRYGSSLESWTGFLFLCASIGYCYLNPKKIGGPVLIVGSMYWLICSGHPQMMYYGILGAAMFALLVPYYIPLFKTGDNESFGKLYFWSKVGICFGAGILLSSAYIVPFYFDFVLTNAGRVGQDIVWADGYRDTFAGTLNNFFYPLRSDVHGAFGGSSIILFVLVIPFLHLFRVKIPRVIWVIIAIVLMIFLYIQGARTPVYYFFWKYFPFTSSFRVAGRATLILPVLFMMLIAWLMRDDFNGMQFKTGNRILNRYSVLVGAVLLLIGIYVCLPESVISSHTLYSAIAIRRMPSYLETATVVIGVIVIVFSAVHRQYPELKMLAFFLCLFTCIQIQMFLHYGTWLEQKQDSPGFSQVLDSKRRLLGYHPAPGYGYGMYSAAVDRHLTASCLEPFLGRFIRKWIPLEDNADYYDWLQQMDLSPDEAVIQGFNGRSKGPDKVDVVSDSPDTVALIYSSYNRLVFNLQNNQPGFFLLSYPFSGHWKATLNGQFADIRQANGIAQAVYVPRSGSNFVEFRYWSWAQFWGIVISGIALIFSGAFVIWYCLEKPLSYFVAAGIVLVAAAGTMFWYKSLYTGRNLSHQYTWTSTITPPQTNFAYGKKTYMSSTFWEDHPHLYHSSRAVDGNRRIYSGSQSSLETAPFWGIDLQRQRMIGRIRLYKNTYLPDRFNQRPLDIYISNNNENWRKIASLTGKKQGRPTDIMFEKPFKTRFIRICASGNCFLQLDEVEIYAPK